MKQEEIWFVQQLVMVKQSCSCTIYLSAGSLLVDEKFVRLIWYGLNFIGLFSLYSFILADFYTL